MLELPKNNSKRIVIQTLAHERPDRLAVFEGSFWDEFAADWRRQSTAAPDVAIEDYYWLDLNVAVAVETLFPTRMREIRRVGDDIYEDDGWGRIVCTRPGTYFREPVERILNKPADLDAIEFDPAGLDCRYGDFMGDVNHHRSKGRAVFVKIGGPFIRSMFFRGEVELLMDMVRDESFARTLIERVGEHLLQMGLESLRRADAYDFGVWIYDDMCNSIAPMFSPQTFERVLMPTYKHMVSSLKAAGARYVMQHCDGNIAPLLDMLIECGIDGINPVEYNSGLDVVELLPKYRNRLVFIGGVCNIHILPSGDEPRIRRHIEALVEAGRNGGLIIGMHSVGPDIPLEAYELYRRIVAERGGGSATR